MGKISKIIDMVLMNTTIKNHDAHFGPAINKLVFLILHVTIIGESHGGKTRREDFKEEKFHGCEETIRLCGEYFFSVFIN